MFKILTHTGYAEPLSDSATPIVRMRQAVMLPRGHVRRDANAAARAMGKSSAVGPFGDVRSGRETFKRFKRCVRVGNGVLTFFNGSRENSKVQR